MTRRIRRLIFGLGLAFACPAVTAGTVKICTPDRDMLPFSSPQFEAPGQYLARQAIERQGDIAEFHAVPWRRCIAGIRVGYFDAVIGAAEAESFASFMEFPMGKEHADAKRSLGALNFVVVRKIGSTANWDGTSFKNLSKPVLYNAGSVIVREKLHELGVPGDLITPNESQMLHMMLSGRADIAIARQSIVDALLAMPSFQGKIEILPIPIVTADAYLAFRRSFHDKSRDYANRVWDEIGRMRAAPDWPDKARHLLAH